MMCIICLTTLLALFIRTTETSLKSGWMHLITLHEYITQLFIWSGWLDEDTQMTLDWYKSTKPPSVDCDISTQLAKLNYRCQITLSTLANEGNLIWCQFKKLLKTITLSAGSSQFIAGVVVEFRFKMSNAHFKTATVANYNFFFSANTEYVYGNISEIPLLKGCLIVPYYFSHGV